MKKKTFTLLFMTLLTVVGAKADVIPSEYYSEVGEGTYYLYDVTSQKFVGRETNRIAFENTPTKTFTLTSGENGGYTIRYDATTTYMMWNHAGQGQSWGADFWMDANGVRDDASGNKYASWNFTLVGSNTYKISTSYSYEAATELTGGTAKYLQGGIWGTDHAESAHEYALIKASTRLIPSSYFSEPAEGTFYLYNVKQGKFLERLGNNFPGFTNTPAAVTLTVDGIGYTIQFSDGKYMHTGYWNKQYLWTDGSNHTAGIWNFNPIGGLTRTFALMRTEEETYEGNTGTFYANGTNAWTSATDDCQWALISAANYTAWQNSFYLSDVNRFGFGSTSDIYNVNPTVNRTMTANVWNTLVVPFDMAIPSGWTVMEPSNFSDGVLSFSTASSIVHGKPYIVKPSEAVSSFSATAVTLYKDLQNTNVSDGALTMTGTYVASTVPTGSYVIGIVNGESALYKVNSTVSVKPFRAYFEFADAEAPARISLNFDGEATGIAEVRWKMEEGRSEYYDLQGRKFSVSSVSSVGSVTLPKGLYIVNGKKVYIK